MIQLIFILFFIITAIGLISYRYTNLSTKYNKWIYIFIYILLFLFVGFREIGIDQDSLGYLNFYNSENLLWLIAEPTFGIISECSRYIFNNFRSVIIIYAIIGLYLKFKAITILTDLKWLSILVYLSTYFLLHEFTQIRAAVASGIFLISIKYLSEKKINTYIKLILIATLFHYSSIILLALVFINNSKINSYKKLIIACIIPAGIILHFLHFNPIATIPIETVKVKIDIYQKTQDAAEKPLNVFNMVYLVKYSLLYLFLFFYPTINKHTTYISILIKIYALSLFSYLALSSNTIFAMRISELLGVVEIILIPYIYYFIRPKSIGILTIILISFIYLSINIFSLELIYTEAISDYSNL